MSRDTRRNLSLLTEQYPRRVVDWRFQRALELRKARDGEEGQHAIGRYGDPLVRRVVLFLSARDLGVSIEDMYEQFPDIYECEQIHTESGLVRWRLEAMIVGDLPVRQIAEMTSLSEDVVHVYEQVFFDIRSRLDRTAFVIDEVIGGLEGLGWSSAHADRLWKALAYLGRQHGAASEVLQAITLDWGPMDPATARLLARVIGAKTLSKGVIASLNAPATGELLNTVLVAMHDSRKLLLDQKRFAFERRKHVDNIAVKARPDHQDSTGDAVKELCDTLEIQVSKINEVPMRVEARADAALLNRLREMGADIDARIEDANAS